MAIKGEIIFPGDKSISHRALMFAALANGESRISNLSTGVDVKSTRNCLEACGIEIGNEGNEVVVNGAELKDGMLRVELEKIVPEAKKPRTIKIK